MNENSLVFRIRNNFLRNEFNLKFRNLGMFEQKTLMNLYAKKLTYF